MTWVVGATTPFGYGVMVSDIYITMSDGTERDLLGKAYPVGRFIVAGFAGSVRVGFTMIVALRNFLRMTDEEKSEHYCGEPKWVAENFKPHARLHFQRQSTDEQSGGCELMLVGVHPVKDALGGGRSVMAILRAPDFQPVIETKWGHVMSIGSGTSQHDAMNALTHTLADFEMMKLEVGSPGGFGHFVGSRMARDLFCGAPPGVSRHMHTTIVGIDRFAFRRNDMKYHSPDGEPLVLRMPKVAESFTELCEMLGTSSEAAVGLRA